MVIAKRFKGQETVRPSMETQVTEVKTYDVLDKALFDRRIGSILVDKRLLPCQIEVLKRFDASLFNGGSRQATRARYLQTGRNIGALIQKDFRDFTKEDVENYLSMRRDLKPRSIHNIKMYSRGFFKWIYKEYKNWKESFEEKYPPLVNWIKLKKQEGNKLPEDILSTEEVKQIISFAKSSRDRALIFTLYESAARRSEILSCRIKHISFDKYGAFIVLPVSKTTPRKLRLINSVPDLKMWLESHPLKDNPEAPLWINLGSWKHSALGPDGLKRLVSITAKNAGIRKKVYPHVFRHSRLTELARQGFNETELRKIAGWSKDSNLPSTYIHLAGGDMDNKILMKAGILDNEGMQKLEDEKQALKIKICPNCKTQNTTIAKFCKNSACNMVLDYKFAIDVDKKREEADNVVTKLLERLAEKDRDLVLETINELKLTETIEKI